LFSSLLAAQAPNPSPPAETPPNRGDQGRQPIYRVEVVQRSIQAVNYGHRTAPTRVDLKGTVLVPEARGEARVESKRGAVEIEAKANRLPAPSRFGAEYLTYVLWAVTPEGRSANLGELVLDPGNKGKLTVSTELQAFALIVTAEPYYAVTQPSNVVVMENIVRPDTVGKVEEVVAKYEFMPRGAYTYNEPSGNAAPPAGAQKLSMDQYEATLALYEALNAIQIAHSVGADSEATSTMQRARQLYEDARKLQSQGAESRQVVTTARQAAQTAEDARAITAKRKP
jgi:hypothetical protein